LLLAVDSGHAQQQRKRLPTEPLEKYQDPPMYIFRLGVSEAMVSQFGGFTSYQVNVAGGGQNITGDAANEPSIAVDPTNHNRMAIGWRQFDSVASNFREAGWAYTSNGGTSWTFPGVLQNNVFRSDPVLTSDSAGRFFYLSLLENFFDDIWRSLTGGSAWARLGPATGGDKQWFTIDNTNSTGRGFQYQSWSVAGNNYGGRQFSRSINGGTSWLNPINIPNSPAWGTLDVDSAGVLYIGGVNLDTNQIWCVRSTNARNAAVIPSFDLSTRINLGGNIASGEPINPEGLVGQVYVAVDRSGTRTNRNVYLLASIQRSGFTNGSDVMFVRSTNFGATFSAPRRVNDDPLNQFKWHWFGTLSVAPNGRLDAVWLDTRNAANNSTSQLFYSYSTNSGVTWSSNVAVSAGFNPFLGYPNQNKMGDYISMVSDNTGADVAYCATFNGEQDIYYVRVAPLASATINFADFNGDTFTDYLLFSPSSRNTAIWYLEGNEFLSGAYGPTPPAAWAVACAADINLDTKPDYVLFNTSTRETAIWFLNNATFLSGTYGPTLPTGWTLVATVDFNNNGRPDYVLFNPSTGQTAIWYLNGANFIAGAYGPTLPAGWSLIDAVDFNNNGKPDFLLFKPGTRQTAVWYLNNATYAGGAYGPTLLSGWTLQGAADFNANAKPDYVLFHASTRQTAIWYLNGVTYAGGAYGPTLPAGF
jgi:hypothetical protein